LKYRIFNHFTVRYSKALPLPMPRIPCGHWLRGAWNLSDRCVEGCDRNRHMAASFLPSILVPLVGIVFPAVAMAFLFLYIEREEAA
jgi:photosystem I subunit 8